MLKFSIFIVKYTKGLVECTNKAAVFDKNALFKFAKVYDETAALIDYVATNNPCQQHVYTENQTKVSKTKTTIDLTQARKRKRKSCRIGR